MVPLCVCGQTKNWKKVQYEPYGVTLIEILILRYMKNTVKHLTSPVITCFILHPLAWDTTPCCSVTAPLLLSPVQSSVICLFSQTGKVQGVWAVSPIPLLLWQCFRTQQCRAALGRRQSGQDCARIRASVTG